MNQPDGLAKLIPRLADSDQEAARVLFEEFYPEIAQFARRRLPSQVRRAADEDDIANSVMRTFVRRAQGGEFHDIDDRSDIWRLLATITARKVTAYIRHETALKRGGGKVRGESAIHGPAHARRRGPDNGRGGGAVGELQVIVEEQLQRLLDVLDDEKLRRILLLRLEGYTHVEIAREIGTVAETVRRKLIRINTIWSREFGDD